MVRDVRRQNLGDEVRLSKGNFSLDYSLWTFFTRSGSVSLTSRYTSGDGGGGEDLFRTLDPSSLRKHFLVTDFIRDTSRATQTRLYRRDPEVPLIKSYYLRDNGRRGRRLLREESDRFLTCTSPETITIVVTLYYIKTITVEDSDVSSTRSKENRASLRPSEVFYIISGLL